MAKITFEVGKRTERFYVDFREIPEGASGNLLDLLFKVVENIWDATKKKPCLESKDPKNLNGCSISTVLESEVIIKLIKELDDFRMKTEIKFQSATGETWEEVVNVLQEAEKTKIAEEIENSFGSEKSLKFS